MIKGPHTQICDTRGAGPECHTVSKDLKAQTKLEMAVYATRRLVPSHARYPDIEKPRKRAGWGAWYNGSAGCGRIDART